MAAENRRPLHVGVLNGEVVLDMRGKLRLISPDEEFFALIFQLDKVIASDPGEAELALWLNLIRSWTFVFELMPSLDQCYWRSINLREHVGTSFDVFYRSCIQRAYEVIQFKLEEERKDPATTLGASAVFQAWMANVKFSTLATGDKAFKLSFVDACLTVYNRMLCIPEVEVLILKGEERNGKDNVWTSIYQLEEVVKKIGIGAGATERTKWVVSAIQDQVDNELLQTSACSTRNLKGQGLPSNKGTVDLFLFKLGVRDLALSTWLEEAGSAVPPHNKDAVRRVFADFATYRQFFGTKVERDTVDMSWLGSFSKTLKEYVTFIEDACFGNKLDRKLKSALAAGAKPPDLPDREEFMAEFKVFRDGWVKERGEVPEQAPQDADGVLASDNADAGQVGQIVQLSFMRLGSLAKGQVDEAKATHEKNLVARHLKSLSEEDLAVVKDLETRAHRLVRSSVKLIVEPERQAVLQEELKSSAIAGIIAAKDKTVLVYYDQKAAGESVTAPHLRVPPLKADRVKTAIQSTCAFADSGGELPMNCMFMISDAGKAGNDRAILNSFMNEGGASMAKHHKSLFVGYKEADLIARLERFKSTAQLNQLETVHVVTSSSAAKQKRRNRRAAHMKDDTSSGNMLSRMPLPESTWVETCGTKKKLFGSQMRIAVGGQTDGEALNTKDGDYEPVFWHSASPLVLEELFRSESWADAVIDWTPTDVTAKKTIDLGIPYVGICYTETHKELLLTRLASLALKDCLTEGHSLYMPAVAKILEIPGLQKKPAAKAAPKVAAGAAAGAAAAAGVIKSEGDENQNQGQKRPLEATGDEAQQAHLKLKQRLEALAKK
ncbi:unnamed protein product [Symbiodinium necroappetens]|uniref:Uncharacterized protein n=1 Tax=Symbiodinium necroappetens TaxID=1628268 RepID=A0A813ACU5_9DINO|nr:unnamed protein product [Symbiodinium necroappetens]